MTYKIEIRKYREPDEKGYRNSDTIYEQEVEDLDLKSVIATVNKIEPAFTSCCTGIIE